MRATKRNGQADRLPCETSDIQGENGAGVVAPFPPGVAGRRALLAMAAATGLACPAIAQPRFPRQPVRLLIPWGAGGSIDPFMRLQAELFLEFTGQPLVLEHRPGARGTMAARFLVTQARPDGYTIAHHHLSVIRHPFLTRRPTWDPVADFTYIIQQSGFLYGNVVHPDAGWTSLAAMWEVARARPGALAYGTSGTLTTNQLAMEDLLAREGASMLHVPFHSSAENIAALLGRQVDCIATTNSWAPLVAEGRLRLLAVWTRDRVPSFPQVPTLRELGYDMVVTSPFGLVGPKGIGPEVRDSLHEIFRRIQFDTRVQDYMDRNHLPDEYLAPQAYEAFARERADYERRLVARLGLTID
jgi:tripartite-type tricarboxylate transporter receptor subunit TctC